MKIWKRKTVLEALACSASTLDRKIKAGQFPAPLRLGENSVGWLESTVIDYLNNLQTAVVIPCIRAEVKRGRPRKVVAAPQGD